MFEEIPPERHGLARVRDRRFVLGPFVVGGGLVLALLGGSVAVAATVITASTIGLSSPPQRPAPTPAAHSSSAGSTSHTAGRPGTAPSGSSRPVATSGASASLSGSKATDTRASGSAPAGRTASGLLGPTRSARPDGLTASSAAGVARPSASGDSTQAGQTAATASPSVGDSATAPQPPNGNAIIFVTGYDASARRIDFRYATVSAGAGVGGSDLYSLQSTQDYSAAIGPRITVISGGLICPPSGNTCTAEELIRAAGTGFFAEVALDPYGTLLSVIERDNIAFSGVNSPPPSTGAAIAAPSATESSIP